ncbi:MAG: hypothetical protein LBV54_05245 [Puniceicoccales bacterium]|jgi:hypothetical protein|nr:hypothetical protein [Puniceicoccales bacterium]
MNDELFHKLLNKYLDGEISGEERILLSLAIRATPRYQKILLQHRSLLAAQRMSAAIAASRRTHARWSFSRFPFGRVCRSAAMLMNAAVLFLSFSLLQVREPFSVDLDDGAEPLAEEVAPHRGGSDTPVFPVAALDSESYSSGSDVAPVNAQEVADLGGDGLAEEEYGFVRL